MKSTPHPPEHTSECFNKPIWTLPALTREIREIPGHLWRVLPTLLGRPIDARLRERIMLAVAGENRCVYCQAAHGALGRAAGLSRQEVSAIVAGVDAGHGERESLALAFARDLARRGFASRDDVLWEALGRHFTDEEREAIEATARVMNFANRFGNTFDAARARLAGRCEHTGASALDLAVVSAVFGASAVLAPPLLGVLAGYEWVRGRGRPPAS
jgi:AhpD family alkylhydroperoxidase